MQRILLRLIWMGCLAPAFCLAAPSIPLGFFARAPAIEDVHLSADGRYVLFSTSQTGKAILKTVDRKTGRIAAVSFGDANEIEIAWCKWARVRRIVCGLRRVSGVNHPGEITRLVAVDADGANVKLLVDNSFGPVNVLNQVVSLGPPGADWIIVQLVQFPPKVKMTEYSARVDLVRLNVVSGAKSLIASASQAMPTFMDVFGDVNGDVFVARGMQGDSAVFWTRSAAQQSWRELFRFRPLEPAPRPLPFALEPGTQQAYALGAGKRHRALFQTSLTGERNDTLLYESDAGPVVGPIYSNYGRVIGVSVDGDEPTAHYLETRSATVIANVNKLLPDRFNEIVDVTPDNQVYLLRSSSDVDPASYHLFDVNDEERKLDLVGSEYPELAQLPLPRTRTIHITTKAGRTARAFVTVPLDRRTLLQPTVVMPDDGPDGRAKWQFNFLRQFLVARGFAVLQVQLQEAASARDETPRNTLNTSGYDAIVSAAQWAIEQRIADPERIAVLGWGYGGYLALLGAQRNSELFRCAVAVNAVSDLTEWPAMEQFVGEDVSWISGPSPRSEAQRTASPVLIINGGHDAVVHPHHSVRLIRSYVIKRVEYEHLEIRDGTHELREQAGRAQMLQRVEQFLTKRLSPR